MNLDEIFQSVQERGRAEAAEKRAREQWAMSPMIARIINNNTVQMSGGMTGAAQVFASLIEGKTFKRKAAEALYTARLFRADPTMPKGGFEFWFARAQRMRKIAQEFARYK